MSLMGGPSVIGRDTSVLGGPSPLGGPSMLGSPSAIASGLSDFFLGLTCLNLLISFT